MTSELKASALHLLLKRVCTLAATNKELGRREKVLLRSSFFSKRHKILFDFLLIWLLQTWSRYQLETPANRIETHAFRTWKALCGNELQPSRNAELWPTEEGPHWNHTHLWRSVPSAVTHFFTFFDNTTTFFQKLMLLLAEIWKCLTNTYSDKELKFIQITIVNLCSFLGTQPV